jgi:hypothetical protein
MLNLHLRQAAVLRKSPLLLLIYFFMSSTDCWLKLTEQVRKPVVIVTIALLFCLAWHDLSHVVVIVTGFPNKHILQCSIKLFT